MHLINKIFNNESIRTIQDKEDEKYYISIVDLVGILSESKDGRKYWRKLNQRLNEEGNEKDFEDLSYVMKLVEIKTDGFKIVKNTLYKKDDKVSIINCDKNKIKTLDKLFKIINLNRKQKIFQLKLL